MAVHEAGHAVAAHSSSCVIAVIEVTVTHDTDFEFAGRTGFIWRGERAPTACWENIVISLAGLAAEAVVYDFFQTGGADKDLEEAHDFAEEIILHERTHRTWWRCPWEITPDAKMPFDFAGCIPLMSSPREAWILNTCYQRALMLVRKNRKQLDALASALEKKNKLGATVILRHLRPR